MKNFFYGIVVGIANIIPGISGSLLLIVFGLYENCIFAISNILKDLKKYCLFLLPIAFGILIGTFLFSNIIGVCLKNYPIITSITFIGFIFGTLPSLYNESIKKGFLFKYLISFFIAFGLGICLLLCKENLIVYNIDLNIYNLIKLVFVGFLIACSTFIPGISSTVLLSLIGMYGIYINAINTINLSILIPIVFGFASGGFILSKIINYLIKNYYGYTYFAIIGFTVSTIPALINSKITFSIDLFIGIILGLFTFIITNFCFCLKK